MARKGAALASIECRVEFDILFAAALVVMSGVHVTASYYKVALEIVECTGKTVLQNVQGLEKQDYLPHEVSF